MLKERPEYERIDFDFPVVKLCDFGASKRQGEKLIASTVNYDSPVSFFLPPLDPKNGLTTSSDKRFGRRGGRIGIRQFRPKTTFLHLA